MKKLPIILMITFLSIVSFGQKKKASPYIFSYRLLPKTTLPVSGINYRSEIITSVDPLTEEEKKPVTVPEFKGSFTEQQEAYEAAKKKKMLRYAFTNLKIDGLNHEPVYKGENYVLSLKISEPIITEYPEGQVKEMDANDVVYKYNFGATVSVKSTSGETLWEKEFTAMVPGFEVVKKDLVLNPVVKLKITNAESEADKAEILNEYLTSDPDQYWVIDRYASYANKVLNEEFGKYIKSNNVGLFYVKGKGYDATDDLSDEFSDLYRGFNALSEKKKLPKSDLDAFFNKAIPVWKEVLNEKSAELEPQALEGLQLNLALAYTWLGQFDEAKVMLEKAEHAKLGQGETADELLVTPSMMNMNAYADHAVGLYSHFSLGMDRIEILH